MMYVCSWCGNRYGEDLIKTWTRVGEQCFGTQLYLDTRNRLAHQLRKEKDVEEVPAEIPVDQDLSGLMTETEPQPEPVGYFMRRRAAN